MSYDQLIQNYINVKYTHAPNWADPCEGFDPWACPPPCLPPCPPCDPCDDPCAPICPPCCDPCPPPCFPCEPCYDPCKRRKKKCCRKNKCSKRKKCQKKKCCKKDRCIKVCYDDPCDPCNRCCINIAPCPPPCPQPCPVPVPVPVERCDPCTKPWLQYWPGAMRSWGGKFGHY